MSVFKGEISVGHVATWVGLAVTIAGGGMAIGQARADIDVLKAEQSRRQQDSNTLIRLETSMEYVEDSVAEILNRLRTAGIAQSNISCPNEKPVLVASYCRSMPTLD